MVSKHVLSFLFYPILIALLFYWQPNISLFSLAVFGIGILAWNIFEYGFHRFAFHNLSMPKKWKRYLANGHRFHHRYPLNEEDILLPLSLTLPFSLLSLGVVYVIFGTENLAWYYLGLILGLYHYEFMHYAAHHLKINLPYFKFMKRYHLLHHHKNPNANFMVSNPVLDYLFTTRRPQD